MDGDDEQNLVIETSTEKCSESILLVDKASKTTLNLVNVFSNAKRIEHRLKMGIKCQEDTPQKLQAEPDVMWQWLQDYDDSKQIQDFVKLLRSADEGDKKCSFLSKTKYAITAARSRNIMNYCRVCALEGMFK